MRYMPKTQVIDVVVPTTADPHTVYALLRDGASWPTFSPLGSFELARPSKDGLPGEGVGAHRIFRTKQALSTVTNLEEIVVAEPGKRYGYILLKGLPLRDYKAIVELEPTPDGGTSIHWTSTFSAKVPGTGALFRRNLGDFIRRLVEGLAAHAATRAKAGA
jgi:hypothetical protein